MVRARNKIYRACQDNPAGHSIRKENERQTEKGMGGQHPGMDWHDAGRRHEKAERREEWSELVVRSSVAPQRSTRLRDR